MTHDLRQYVGTMGRGGRAATVGSHAPLCFMGNSGIELRARMRFSVV
jgi:hypothetical protein